MDRRSWLVGFLGFLATPLVVAAQPAGRVPRIGYLSSGSVAGAPQYVEAFRQGLRELGWTEGQNILIEYRAAEGRVDRLPDLAAELVRLEVKVIVATLSPATMAAKNATATIPIVTVNTSDPVGLGLVPSLARPGGNVTGVAYTFGTEIFGKGLELLKEAVPNVRRVAVLSNPANPGQLRLMGNVTSAARALGLQLQLLEARGPDEFDGAFAAMVKERAGALVLVGDAVLSTHRRRLAELAVQNRLPSMHTNRADMEAGGLMSYGANLVAQYRRAAVFVDKILRGAKPADLPVEQPTKFEFVINLKTAKALGLTIPPSVLARADEIIG